MKLFGDEEDADVMNFADKNRSNLISIIKHQQFMLSVYKMRLGAALHRLSV